MNAVFIPVLGTVITFCFALILLGIKNILSRQNKMENCQQAMRREVKESFDKLPEVYMTRAACQSQIATGACFTQMIDAMKGIKSIVTEQHKAYQEKADYQKTILDYIKETNGRSRT